MNQQNLARYFSINFFFAVSTIYILGVKSSLLR